MLQDLTDRIMDSLRSGRAAIFLLMLVPWLILVQRFWWTCEDAHISFRYARNFALGHGLRFNLGDHTPVEGYSNFLWVVAMAPAEAVGLDTLLFANLVLVACSLSLLASVWVTVRTHFQVGVAPAALAVLCLGASPPFAVWTTSGLETMAFALALFLAFERIVLAGDDGPLAVAAGLAAALLRTEGIAWIGVMVVLALLQGHRPKRSVPAIFGLFALYFAARYAYYGLPFANTAYAKADLSFQRMIVGARHVTAFYVVMVAPALWFLGAVAVDRRSWPVAVMAVAVPVWVVVVGGDYMAFGRMLVPGLAFGAVLVALLAEILVAVRYVVPMVALLGLGPAFGWHVVSDETRADLHFRLRVKKVRSELQQWQYMKRNVKRWTNLARAMRQHADPDASWATATIGCHGYYSGLFIHDAGGLVSREVTEHGTTKKKITSPGHTSSVNPAWFRRHGQRRPTYLRASIAKKGLARKLDKLDRVHRGKREYVPHYWEHGQGWLVVLRLLEEGEDRDEAFAAIREGL